ncbi:MAG: DsbA family protein [Acidimicrobiia bacterium]
MPPLDKKLKVFYDYTCGHSYRVKKWFDIVTSKEGVQIEWKTMSLKEFNREEGEPSVFEDPGLESISVLALALAHAVRGADFAAYHDAIFDAIHEEHRRLAPEDIMDMAKSAGMKLETFEENAQKLLEGVVREHHEGLHKWNAFGTPTVVFDDEVAVYLESFDLPHDDDHALELWRSLLTFSEPDSGLNEWKRSQ